MLRRQKKNLRKLRLPKIRFHSLDDRLNLRRVNTPHPQISELAFSAESVFASPAGIGKFRRDIVRRHLAERQRRRRDLRFGAHN